mmetsp:Transcript_29172/g.88438  ORF Transcript_29172/g.88438 Transcript_29172/m.88438 type:complete len:202 (-) Transcript_29172:1355-1960(-)
MRCRMGSMRTSSSSARRRTPTRRARGGGSGRWRRRSGRWRRSRRSRPRRRGPPTPPTSPPQRPARHTRRSATPRKEKRRALPPSAAAARGTQNGRRCWRGGLGGGTCRCGTCGCGRCASPCTSKPRSAPTSPKCTWRAQRRAGREGCWATRAGSSCGCGSAPPRSPSSLATSRPTRTCSHGATTTAPSCSARRPRRWARGT